MRSQSPQIRPSSHEKDGKIAASRFSVSNRLSKGAVRLLEPCGSVLLHLFGALQAQIREEP